MRRPFLALSMLAVLLCSQHPAVAADVAPLPAAPVFAEPPPTAVVPVATACWRYGGLGWGWYPCYAGPPAYRHSHHDDWYPDWARRDRWYR